MKIAGGAPGAGKVLTSDAAGTSSWTKLTGTIAQTISVAGLILGAVPAAADTWEFIGPVTQVTVNGNQRIVLNYAAVLGRSSDQNSSTEFQIHCSYRPVGGSMVEDNAYPWPKPYFPASITSSGIQSSIRSYKPAAGNYAVGIVLRCGTASYLNHNEYVQGTITIINK